MSSFKIGQVITDGTEDYTIEEVNSRRQDTLIKVIKVMPANKQNNKIGFSDRNATNTPKTQKHSSR